MEFEIEEIAFTTENDDFRSFVKEIRRALTHSEVVVKIDGKTTTLPVLIPEIPNDPHPPIIDVKIHERGRWVIFRIRRDNLYVIGFKRDNDMVFYAFLNEGRHIGEEGTIELGFDSSYKGIKRASHKRGPYNLGRTQLVGAVSGLLRMDNPLNEQTSCAGYLNIVIRMISECIRLKKVRVPLCDGWSVYDTFVIEGDDTDITSWTQYSDNVHAYYDYQKSMTGSSSAGQGSSSRKEKGKDVEDNEEEEKKKKLEKLEELKGKAKTALGKVEMLKGIYKPN